MTNQDKATLRALAGAATPGFWQAGSKTVFADETEDCLGLDVRLYGGNRQQMARNARYIAAANPATVLALLDENERLQAEVEGLRKDAERWRRHQANKENYVPMFARAGELGFACPENPKPEEFKAWDMGLLGRCVGTMAPAWHLRKEGSPENFTKAFEMGWLECMAHLNAMKGQP